MLGSGTSIGAGISESSFSSSTLTLVEGAVTTAGAALTYFSFYFAADFGSGFFFVCLLTFSCCNFGYFFTFF